MGFIYLFVIFLGLSEELNVINEYKSKSISYQANYIFSPELMSKLSIKDYHPLILNLNLIYLIKIWLSNSSSKVRSSIIHLEGELYFVFHESLPFWQ